MKLWQARARTLPVTVRPIGGETIPSYARRLAEANDVFPTAILRAIGEHRYGTGHHLLRRDLRLNDQAIDRLATYAGIARDRLGRALPALSEPLPAYPIQPLPTDRPAVYSYTPWTNPRPACRHCTLHRAIGPNPSTALIRPEDPHAPLLCNRHRRWLGTCSDTTQYDLSHAGEIITAAHRYQELLAGHPDPEWVIENLQAAWRITQNWAQHPPNRLSKTAKRWRARAEALGIPGALQQPVVSYPEAVTLTGVLIDLTWRRHVAMVEEWELARFYQAITHRLGEPGQDRQPGSRLLWGQRDALTRWVDTHRCRFSAVRRHHQAEQQRHWFAIPLPEKGHFK